MKKLLPVNSNAFFSNTISKVQFISFKVSDMKMLQLLLLAWVLIFGSLTAQGQVAGDYRTNVTTVTWATASHWQRFDGTNWIAATAAPTSTNSETVYILDGHTVNATTGTISAKNLVVGGGVSGILNIGGITFTVTGSTTIESGGRINIITSTAGTKTFTGDFVNNGIWSNTINEGITFGGNITNNGTFTSGTGQYLLTNANRTINGTFVFASISNNGTRFNNGDVTVTTTFAGAQTFTNNANSILNIGAASVSPPLVASAVPNVVSYNRNGTQTIRATTYHNLEISNSNTKTLAGAIIVNNNIDVTGTAVLADGGNTITGNAAGTFSVGAGAGYTTTRTATPWFPTNASIVLDDNSTVTYGGALTALNNSIPSSYGNLTFSGSSTKTLPASFPVLVKGNLVITTTTLADNGNIITVNGNISGSGTHSGAGKILLTGGTAPHDIRDANWGNVELDDVQGAVLGNNFSISFTGSFTLTTGIVTLGNFDFSIFNVNNGALNGSGFSSSKMFLQTGTGELRRQIGNTGLPIVYEFPIGRSGEYSPVSMNFSANATLAFLAFNIINAQHPNDANTTDFVSRYWVATEVPSSFTYSATFGFDAGDVNGDPALYDVYLHTLSPNNWKNIPATVSGNTITYDGTDGTFASGSIFTIKAPLNVVSPVTIGLSGTYPTLTGEGGLFDILNQGVISGNLVANVISTPISEPGTIALNPITESGTGNYTVTIQSNNATPKELVANYNVATFGNIGAFRLNGADRVNFNGGTGTDRRLIFRNTNTGSSATVFHFQNDASDNTINNCTIEGAYSGLTGGLITIGSSTISGTGNDNITITNCDIKQVGTYTGATTYNVGIYGSGFSTSVTNDNILITNNNIYNFNQTGTSNTAAIRVQSGNTNWNISNNNFYQTSSISTTLGTTHNIIYLNSGSSNGGHTVSENNIGLFGTGAVTYQLTTASSGTHRLTAIRANVGTSSSNPTTITNNIITGFNIRTSSGGSTSAPFTGIAFENGSANITGNIIGDTTGNNHIVTLGSTAGAISIGINNTNAFSGSVVNIENNFIGGVSSNGTSATISNGFIGISNSSNNTIVKIANNKIGSLATANNIRNLNANSVTATGTAQVLYGISSNGSAGGIITIEGNTIANLSNNGATTSTSTITRGITVTGNALYDIKDNTIFNLSTSASNTATGATAGLIGIVHNGGGTSQNISNNTIYNLEATNAANVINMYGIVWNVTNSLTNSVSKNYIHSFTSNNSNIASEQAGILVTANFGAVFSNNMIRLGIKADGSSINNSNIITGILDLSTAPCNYYFNTVLINGTVSTSTTANSYAYRRTATSGSKDIRNNIFANNRTGGSATSFHYAFATNGVSGYTAATFDNNIFYSQDGSLFSTSATPALIATPRFQNFRFLTNLSNGSSGVAGSLADINFVDANGDVASVNLKLNNTSAAADAAVVIATIGDDREGDVRSGTTPDIGADEGPTDPIDLIAPRISNVTSVANISSACGTTATVNISATVVDAGSGVAGSPLQPQLWWRLSTGTYVALAPVSVSGNIYNYELNLTGVASGQVYQYYIAAQDVAGNISYSHFNATSPVHADVATTPSTINGAPATFNVIATTPLSGTVTVGTSGDYLRFNGTGGLFEAINTRGLSGNLQVNVISNIAELANWTPLNQWQEFCGTGYSVTISPNSATVYTIEANSSAANAMFSFYGVNRLYIDGRFDGSGRYLLLRHNRVTSIYASTVEYNNGAANNVLRNCIIEGANINNSNNTTGSVGVVRIGGSMGFAGGNLNNITIQDNEIRNLSNITPSLTNVPMNLIYLGGANSSANINNITITGNDLYNFQTSAIRADNGGSSTNSIGNNIAIINNNIYQELIIPTYQYPIVLDAVGNTYGHVISGNKIGGSSKPNPDITGTWTNNKVDGEVVGIYLNVGDAPTQIEGSSINNNIISNISITGTQWANFIGIRAERGRVNVTGNTIGSLASSLSSPNIIMAGNGGLGITDNSMMAGIWTQSTEEVVIDSNIVCGLATTSGFSFMDGIAHGSNLYFNGFLYNTPGGKATITNNQVLFCRSSSALQNLAIPSPEGFMGIFTWTNQQNNIISNNQVRNCGSGTAIWNRNVRIHGMFIGVYGSTTAQTGTVSNNEISHLFNENPGDNASSTSRNPIIYGLSIANGNWTVANNTIYLNNGTQGGTVFTDLNTSLRGLNDGMLFNQANCQARYYNNTVYVSGANISGAGQANSTYAFLRFPLDYGLISITAGAPVELRNNVFINDRGGQGNHRAIGNIANTNSDASVNWNNTASDYNLFSTPDLNNVALWGSSTTYTLANFRTLSGNGDQNTDAVVTTTGTSSSTSINPSELFLNVGTGAANLRINTTPPNTPYPFDFVDQKGTPVSLTVDIDNDLRSTTAPTKGADEIFTACPSITINTQPSPNNICEGSNTFFTVDASGVGLSYQWQVNTGSGFNNITNGGSYANAQTNQLNINNTPESFNGYEYRVVISSTCTTAVNSAEVTLTVNALPEITVEPANATVAAGSNTSFSITASGSGTITYVWQLSTDGGTNWNNVPNSAPYSNVNTATLDITAATAGMNNYQYRVIINNGCNVPDTSTVAVLTVTVSCADNIWTGTINNLWEEAGNWSCGVVPDTSINVVIPNVTNDPVININITGGTKNITIQPGANLTMVDNAILEVSGNFDNEGSFSFSGTSVVTLLGERIQTIKSSWTSGATNSFNVLTINKATTSAVSLIDNLNVLTKTNIDKGEFIVPQDVTARSKKVELKDKLLIQAVTNGTKAGEFRVNE